MGQHLNVLSMGNNILSPVIELSLSDIGRETSEYWKGMSREI